MEWISVGGIDSPEEALKRLELGASRIQFYTGWIYQGPFFAWRILSELRKKQN
jgi:dihydroorotate dehydrogenase